jgi:hypothetical protein
MIPDDPIIRFGKHDTRITSAEVKGSSTIDATDRLRSRLKRMNRRLHEVPEPKDFRPIGYEW